MILLKIQKILKKFKTIGFLENLEKYKKELRESFEKEITIRKIYIYYPAQIEIKC